LGSASRWSGSSAGAAWHEDNDCRGGEQAGEVVADLDVDGVAPVGGKLLLKEQPDEMDIKQTDEEIRMCLIDVWRAAVGRVLGHGTPWVGG
jgi:hypothetical protein